MRGRCLIASHWEALSAKDGGLGREFGEVVPHPSGIGRGGSQGCNGSTWHRCGASLGAATVDAIDLDSAMPPRR